MVPTWASHYTFGRSSSLPQRIIKPIIYLLRFLDTAKTDGIFQNFTIISTLNCKFTFQCYCQLQRSVPVQSSQSLNWLFYFISIWLHIPSNNHHCQSLCIVCSDLHCSISFSFFQDHRHNYLLQTTKLSWNSNGLSYNHPVDISLQSWIWIWLVTCTGRFLHHKSTYMVVKNEKLICMYHTCNEMYQL